MFAQRPMFSTVEETVRVSKVLEKAAYLVLLIDLVLPLASEAVASEVHRQQEDTQCRVLPPVAYSTRSEGS